MKNIQGFVLVETIVAAVFVLSLFSFLIANILPLVGEYEKSYDYDSIESKYDAHLIRKMILKDNSCRASNLVKLADNDFYVFNGDEICLYLENVNYCKTLLSENYLDVKKIVLSHYNVENLKKHTDYFERAVSEYITYMPNYSNTAAGNSDYFYKRRLIVWFNDGRITNIDLLMNHDGSVCGGASC